MLATTEDVARAGIPLYMLTGKNLALALVALFFVVRILKVASGLKSVSYLPGLRSAFEPFSLMGATMPASWWNPGINFQWSQRDTLYRRFGLDTISIVPFVWGSANIWTANLDVAKQVVAGGPSSSWIKPQDFSRALLFWGMNLAAADNHDTWRRHRRVMGPAFNNKTYMLVWSETLRLYKDMMAHEGWINKDIIDIPVVQHYTFKLALFVISGCGFGLPGDWNEAPASKDGSMSLQEALRLTSEWNFMRTMAPKWVWRLPIKQYHHVERAYLTIETFMREQVALRKAEIRQELSEGREMERSDVFSRLVLANESETEKLPVDDQELIGNTFVLLFAGHETTGHTLAAALGYLGVYQEEQDIVYEQIMDVVGNDRDPTFEDYPALYKVLAAFYESLRLIPAGSVMIRRTVRDTTLTIPHAEDKNGSQNIFMAKGSTVFVDLLGIQYNPRYFPDPYAYRPSRWYEQETSGAADTFTAFSVGPRACIGRKFATTEAVCWLAMLLRDFKVEIVLNPGETREQWRERILQATIVMTLSVGSVPIRLVKRT